MGTEKDLQNGLVALEPGQPEEVTENCLENKNHSNDNTQKRIEMYGGGGDGDMEHETAAIEYEDEEELEGIKNASRKLLEQNEFALRLIKECQAACSKSLDLSNRSLRAIPEELLECTQLEYLYLEGNQLSFLPEEFFDKLPYLVWLDLRNNNLVSIPSVYIGRHQHLRNLLLEKNDLKTLPLELGLIPSLHGLNISNNPLDFPPQEVIEKGTVILLQFFRDLLAAKSQGHLLEDGSKIESLNLGDITDESSGSERRSSGQSRPFGKNSRHSNYRRSSSVDSYRSDLSGELVGPVPKSMSLHTQKSYSQLKEVLNEKLRKAGAYGSSAKSGGRRARSTKEKEVSLYPSPPPVDRVEQKYLEEKRLSELKEMKMKQDYIIQKRKDTATLKDWQMDTKKKQQDKYRESYMGIEQEYDDATKTAPYGIDESSLKMPTNEERIAQDVKSRHEKIRRAMSPATLQKMHQEREARDRDLERRIKEHTMAMQERGRRAKGTPQEEMEAAKRELEIAKNLQDEIVERRKALEYRFKAYVGDP